MRLVNELTDDAVLVEVGQRLSRLRLDRGLTQAQLAEQSGISKRTLERLEAGAPTQLANFIRVARVLDLLAALDALLPGTEPSPMALLRSKGREPQRARKFSVSEPASDWTWGDDA